MATKDEDKMEEVDNDIKEQRYYNEMTDNPVQDEQETATE